MTSEEFIERNDKTIRLAEKLHLVEVADANPEAIKIIQGFSMAILLMSGKEVKLDLES